MKPLPARTRASRSHRSSTNPMGIGIVFILILMAPGMLCAADMIATAPVPNEQALPKVKTYSELLSAIREVRTESLARVAKAVEQERVREAWETGKLINEYVLQNKERADYGKQVIEKLAKDLGMSRSELNRMVEFARAYPIRAPARKLSWAHYRELLAVNDETERKILAEQAVLHQWSRDEFRQVIRSTNGPQGKDAGIQETLPPSTPGKPGTYRIVRAPDGELVVDLGFSTALGLRHMSNRKYKPGTLVQSTINKKGHFSIKKAQSQKDEDDLFTYKAYVEKIIDGDTFKAVIDLGFGIITTQTIRLKGIDAPEIEGSDGMEAKQFVETALEGVKFVAIKTTQTDKYGRYLGDVWIPQKDGSNLYLNNELLITRNAVRVRS